MLAQARADAAKFLSLRLSLARATAEMELSQEQYAPAIAAARRNLRLMHADDLMAASWQRVLGLGLLRSGRADEGRLLCEQALTRLAGTTDHAGLRQARLAVLEARVVSRDRAGAAQIFAALEPVLADTVESRWKALALLARLQPEHAAAARTALAAVRRAWGEPVYARYSARPDIRRLARPLLPLHPATTNQEN